MSKNHLHIGEKILRKLEEEKLSVRWLAGKVKKDPSNLRRTLKKKSMDSDLLHSISEVLHYDFLQYYNSDKKDEVKLTSL